MADEDLFADMRESDAQLIREAEEREAKWEAYQEKWKRDQRRREAIEWLIGYLLPPVLSAVFAVFLSFLALKVFFS